MIPILPCRSIDEQAEFYGAVPLSAVDRTRIAPEVDRAADLLVAAEEAEETR
jgi:hypothetical protein